TRILAQSHEKSRLAISRKSASVEAAGIAGHLGRDARNRLQNPSISAGYEKSCVPSKTRFWTAIRSKSLFLSDPSDHASTEGRELPPLNLGRINNAFPCLVANSFGNAGCRR